MDIVGIMLVLLLVDGVMLPLAEFTYLARTVHATATTLAFLRKKNLYAYDGPKWQPQPETWRAKCEQAGETLTRFDVKGKGDTDTVVTPIYCANTLVQISRALCSCQLL